MLTLITAERAPNLLISAASPCSSFRPFLPLLFDLLLRFPRTYLEKNADPPVPLPICYGHKRVLSREPFFFFFIFPRVFPRRRELTSKVSRSRREFQFPCAIPSPVLRCTFFLFNALDIGSWRKRPSENRGSSARSERMKHLPEIG